MMPQTASPPTDRQAWMATLAKAPVARLEDAWSTLSSPPAYTFLRPAEVGSALIRGRAGGTGQRFNLGEMTVARCVVRLDDGTTGFGYVAGRNKRHAELAALFDALMQAPGLAEEVHDTVIVPLAADQAAQRDARSREAASTRVDFFTMVRGEG